MSDPRPLGVFDSGVGGLTVLRELQRQLPNESTIYFADGDDRLGRLRHHGGRDDAPVLRHQP